MSRPGSVVTFIALGLGAGIAVTRRAHRAPSSPGWDRRVGRSRLRRSDLPLGGTAALVVAGVLRGAGWPRAAQAVTAVGLGAAAGAVGTGLAEPLPPFSA
jgi:hypothetical protein